MSRCYTFPPLGYVWNEILIESIKGAKEDLKKDRKHKKKDKKREERDNKAERSKKYRRRKDETARCGLINSEVELLEKSCLTVELEQQTSSSQNSCDSSIHRPTQVLQSRSLDGRHNDSEIGKRINKDPKQSSSLESGHLYSTCANEDPRDASLRDISTKLGKDEEKPSSSHQEAVGHTKLLCSKRFSSMEVRFLNLIENWAPDHRVESKLADPEDQEWWVLMKFGVKRDQHHQVSNQRISEASSSMVWPTARFLPEAQLHALPFTVPF